MSLLSLEEGDGKDAAREREVERTERSEALAEKAGEWVQRGREQADESDEEEKKNPPCLISLPYFSASRLPFASTGSSRALLPSPYSEEHIALP